MLVNKYISIKDFNKKEEFSKKRFSDLAKKAKECFDSGDDTKSRNWHSAIVYVHCIVRTSEFQIVLSEYEFS
jgi:hypothetical protein